jgi:CDP-2,3-bis-(O-geranylgeranyl)-sn-glycerol synthase
MQLILILKLALLLMIANGAPVIARDLFGRRYAYPLDGGVRFLDGRPVFGPSKTIRGILLSVLATTACAPLVGLDWIIGAQVGGAAMAGDLFSSFLKRRLRLPAGAQAVGLDQIPESLFPLLACRAALSLAAVDIALGVGIFFFSDVFLSRLLFKFRLRDRPY